jgi:hypothetical protein
MSTAIFSALRLHAKRRPTKWARTADLSATIKNGHTFAATAFFLIFPAYFYYQTFAQAGYIEPVLGGYFTAGAIAAMPLLILGYWQQARSQLVSGSPIAFLFLFFLAFFGLHVLFGIQSGANEETTLPHLAYIVKFFALFLLARVVNGQERRFHRLCTLLLIGIIATVIATGSEGQFLQASILEAFNEGFQLDYQGLAYAYVVLVIYCAPSLSRGGRIALYASSLPVLFLIGARSEFAGFFLLAGAIELCKSKSRVVFLLVVLTLAVISAVAYVALENELSDHRIFGLLKLSSDESALERRDLHRLALQTIDANPVLGSYASYEPGHYAHNILSAWVDLGFAGFLLLMVLLAMPTLSLLHHFRRCSRDDLYVQCLASMLFTVMLLAFAKNYTYQMTPIAIGLYCRFYVAQRMRATHRVQRHALQLHGARAGVGR